MEFDLQKYISEVQQAMVCRIVVEGFAPDDRMYHAADKTWWRWDGHAWKAAEPPTGWIAPNKEINQQP